MKKSFIILLAAVTAISCVFASCSSKDEDTTTTAAANTGGLADVDTEYGFETQEVTDEDGKKVTDKDGKTVTEEVQVIYKKDKDGNEIAQLVDQKTGDGVTNKKGEPVTVKTTKNKTTDGTTKVVDPKKTTTTEKGEKPTTTAKAVTTKDPTTATTKKNVKPTSEENSDDTTKLDENITVPKTSATGTEVNLSEADLNIIASMLKVPHLCDKSYENSDGVPIEIATYTALWMCQRNSISGTAPSGTVVLDLFRYYGQTVVNFKTKCNDAAEKVGAPIEYDKSNDTFSIKSFPKADHDIVITKVEDLNNNFFKVTATVSGCDNAKKVVAIVQKNKLDINLGFSIKALKWS